MDSVPGKLGERTVRGRALAAYIADAANRRFPAEVLDAAMRTLVDSLGVSIGAVNDEPVQAVRRAVVKWRAPGKARIFLGPCTHPALAVLVNATMTHAMDFDDAHPMGAGHVSGPCWSTALALAGEVGANAEKVTTAFLTGFEVMAKLGGGLYTGVGRNLQRRGFHPTSILGRMGAAATACVLLGLDEQQIAHALGLAATTAGGLLRSFGTHSKPFHSGKAAMDGVMAAQLAAEGFVAATHLFELRDGWLDAFIQNREVEVPPLDFDSKWEILGNAFKPYASCRGTHPSTQAACSLAGKIAGRKIAGAHAKVHPGAMVTAGKLNPKTPLEGKFSVPFCIALGLTGHRVGAPDFCDSTMRDATVMELVPRITIEPIPGQAPCSAHLDVFLEDGEHLHADVDVVLGHPDNPMSWQELRTKFEGLVEPILGTGKTADLFVAASGFMRPGAFGRITELLEPCAGVV